MLEAESLLLVEKKLRVLTAPTGIPIYDFDFRSFLQCRTVQTQSEEHEVVARIGAFLDYSAAFAKLRGEGIRLVHSPEEHLRCSRIDGWYPLIEDVTPRSRWFEEPPEMKVVAGQFGWPVFLKGIRQTNRHRRSTSIIENAEHFRAAIDEFKHDPILGWQPVVVREYIPLRMVEDLDPTRIPSSYEFRTFWWRGRSVGSGRYWWQGRHYHWTDSERTAALALGAQVARQVNVTFLVVDLAMTKDGQWIVIECNDGQESGYAGVLPLALWQNIASAE